MSTPVSSGNNEATGACGVFWHLIHLHSIVMWCLAHRAAERTPPRGHNALLHEPAVNGVLLVVIPSLPRERVACAPVLEDLLVRVAIALPTPRWILAAVGARRAPVGLGREVEKALVPKENLLRARYTEKVRAGWKLYGHAGLLKAYGACIALRRNEEGLPPKNLARDTH